MNKFYTLLLGDIAVMRDKEKQVVSVLYDAWDAPHPEKCVCYKCSGNPESFGFVLINEECQLCKNENRQYCLKECPVRLEAIKNFNEKT